MNEYIFLDFGIQTVTFKFALFNQNKHHLYLKPIASSTDHIYFRLFFWSSLRRFFILNFSRYPSTVNNRCRFLTQYCYQLGWNENRRCILMWVGECNPMSVKGWLWRSGTPKKFPLVFGKRNKLFDASLSCTKNITIKSNDGCSMRLYSWLVAKRLSVRKGAVGDWMLYLILFRSDMCFNVYCFLALQALFLWRIVNCWFHSRMNDHSLSRPSSFFALDLPT